RARVDHCRGEARLRDDPGGYVVLHADSYHRQPGGRSGIRSGRSENQVPLMTIHTTTTGVAQPTSTLSAEPALPEQRGLWTDAWRRLIRNRLALLGLTVLLVVVVLAFVGSEFGPTARFAADEQDYTAG